jgi:hypothetical protein
MSDIYLLLKTQALHDTINKTDAYFYRKIIRWYSNTFHTPLKQVETLDWYEILQHYYEHNYDQLNNNDLVNLIKQTVPQLDKQEQDSFEEWIKQVQEQANKEQALKEQKQSLDKASKDQSSKQEPPTNTPDIHRTFDLEEEP